MYFSAGYPVGVYILDVIVDLGSNQRGAYETILVILDKNQPPIQPAQIINKVKQNTDIQIIFEDDKRCSNKPGSAGLAYPQDKRTECEKIDYDECEKKGMKTSGGFCDNIYELFWDNDCFGFANGKECDEYFNDIAINSVKRIPIIRIAEKYQYVMRIHQQVGFAQTREIMILVMRVL